MSTQEKREQIREMVKELPDGKLDIAMKVLNDLLSSDEDLFESDILERAKRIILEDSDLLERLAK